MANTTDENPSLSWLNETVDQTNITNFATLFFNKTHETSLAEEVASWMSKYIAPSLLFIAVFGNLTAFAVFSMPSYRHSSTAMLYRVLAVADTMAVVLYDGISILAMRVSGKDLMTHNTVTCKLFVPLRIWSRAFSAWVLAIIALERVIGILYPHRARVFNTKRRFGWITCSVAAGLLAFYSPLFITIEQMAVEFDPSGGYCVFNRDRTRFVWYFRILGYVSLLLTCLLPFVFIISFNIAIVCALVKRRKDLSRSQRNDHHRNNAAAILVAVSVTFVILTTPYALYIILQDYYLKVGDMVSYKKTFILFSYATIFDSVNHSINVVLYCLCGRKFRQCLREMMCCECWKKGTGGRSSTNAQTQKTDVVRLNILSSTISVRVD